MHSRQQRSAPTRSVAPFHRGPQAATAPAAGAGAPMHQAPNAALLIDFDNVTMGIRSDLQGELNNLLSSDIIKGKVAVRRAYADWRRYPQYIVPLTESSIDLIFAPAYGSSKKNATDIRLAIDAMELVFTRPEIGTFVLLSGDSDFSSMVIKLKEYGKYVIGVGIRESSSDLLVMNCDEYYSYNALAGLTKTGDDESTRWDPWELVKESVTRMKRNGDVMRSDRLKQVMQEIDQSFDEKDLGMPKFSRFVQEAAHKGLLKVTKLDSGQLEIDAPSGEMIAAAAATGAATPAASTTDAADSVDADGATPDMRREREREREDRRGRRGRRGRGRERDRGERGEADGLSTTAEFIAQTATDPASVPPAASIGSPVPAAATAPPVADALAAPIVASAVEAAPATDAPPREDRGGRGRDRGRGRGRDRDRGERTDRKPEVESQAQVAFGETVADSIGTSGERLTRSEAFDLVRRSVESLVQGEDATSASAARQRAFGLLGRDSESLSSRNFERILQDAHDANMIDLRRRGNDFELARAVDAAPIVEQLRTVELAQQAAAALTAPPAAPRGMGARGVGGRGMGGRGKPGGPSPELLMVGVVGPRAGTVAAPVVAAPAPAAAPAAAPAPNAAPAAVAEAAPVLTAAPGKATPVAAEAPVAESLLAAPEKKTAKTAAKAPAKAAKTPVKTPAKKAAKAPAKAPAKTAPKPAVKAPAKAAKTTEAAKPKAPAKKAAKAVKG